ncbi:MAG TPA: ABC transporter permease [Chloroflexi bacterium]|nr:ABC transporter permease [Chloroflexota bacterium]
MLTFKGFISYVRRNPALGIGMGILLFLILFVTVGRLFVDESKAYALSVPINQPPSKEYPFGTDSQGKDLLAGMVVGTGMTLTIGFIAGAIGLGLGALLGFTSGYYGGTFDTVVKFVVDVLMTIPSFLLLILIATTLSDPSTLKPVEMALILSITAWVRPTRTIRAQVLSMKERPFVMMAKLSGMSGIEIILKEMMPNLLPFLAISLAGAVSGAVLGSLGLESLGIGNRREPTLGMMIYWVRYYAAFIRGMWWWIMEPIIAIALVFIAFLEISIGLDEIANPRTRRRV